MRCAIRLERANFSASSNARAIRVTRSRCRSSRPGFQKAARLVKCKPNLRACWSQVQLRALKHTHSINRKAVASSKRSARPNLRRVFARGVRVLDSCSKRRALLRRLSCCRPSYLRRATKTGAATTVRRSGNLSACLRSRLKNRTAFPPPREVVQSRGRGRRCFVARPNWPDENRKFAGCAQSVALRFAPGVSRRHRTANRTKSANRFRVHRRDDKSSRSSTRCASPTNSTAVWRASKPRNDATVRLRCGVFSPVLARPVRFPIAQSRLSIFPAAFARHSTNSCASSKASVVDVPKPARSVAVRSKCLASLVT